MQVFFLLLFLLLTADALCFLLPPAISQILYGAACLLVCAGRLPLWWLPVFLFHTLLQPPHALSDRPIRWSILCAACALLSVGLRFQIAPPSPLPGAETLFACLLAIVFSRLTLAYDTLYLRYIHSQDDYTERQLLLLEKNRALLERQNSEIYAATLKERNRIAREIHDNVGHMLTRSILMTGALRTIHTNDTLSLPLEQLEDSLNLAMTTIRESVHDLHDDSLNLEQQTRQLTQEFPVCPVEFQYDMGYDPAADIRYAFLSIVKEALANIARHSNATHASVTMREHPGFYQLIVADNGTERRPEAAPRGMGLENMRERVRQLKGSLQITTEAGFQIRVIIPKTDCLS